MRNIRKIWYAILNIVLGGMAFTTAVISISKTSGTDAIYFYLIGFLTWIFALIVFISKPDNNIAHFSYLMSVGLMSVCSVNGIFSITDTGLRATFVPLFQFVAAAFLPCVFLRCFAVFPSPKRFAMNRFFRWWVYAPGLILSAGMFISYRNGANYERLFFLIDMPGFLIPNIICLFGYSIAGHVCLAHSWIFGETATQRYQAKWLFWGICIGTAPVFFIHTIPSVLGAELSYSRFSAYTLVLIPICYIIAILRYRLMDIEFVFNRSSVYAIASSVILAIYLASSYVLGKAFLKIHIRSAKTADLFSILIAALLFAPMKNRIQEFINIYFDQRRYNYRQTLENLSETLSAMLQLDELSGVLLHQLYSALRPEFAALLLRGESGYGVYGNAVGDTEKLEEALREFGSAAIKDSPERVGERNLAVPLLRKYRLVGFILLGGKRSGSSYNAEDISLLEVVSHQAAISIDNAIIYRKLHEQVDLMTGAYNRLVDTFKQYHPDVPPENPVSENEDIILELNVITEALVRSSEKLRELDNAKSQLLQNVSHELRTPLVTISLSAKNMLEGIVGEIDGIQKEYMERIFRNCSHLIDMVDDLLDLSRIGRNEMELYLTKLQLFPLISNVVSDLQPFAVKKGLSLNLNCPPDVTISADRDKLRRIVTNLIDNAIKFTPSGGGVSVCVEDKGECVEISVEDTGVGISAESYDEIFDRFQKVRGSGRSAGMGLGLAIVKGFVELHGGEIFVDSEVGKGSKFTITLERGAAHQPHEES